MRGTTNTTYKRQITALTGLRIIAALWVVLHHLSGEIFTLIPQASFAEPIISRGGLGVDLFFVLSGFILTYQYFDRLGPTFRLNEFLHFLKLRIARVYPVHFVTLNLTVALFFAAQFVGVGINQDGAVRTLGAYIQNLFLVHGWADQPYSWNGASWSVSAEWFAYLLFPFAVVALFKVRSRGALWAGVLLPAALYICLQAWVLELGTNDRPDNVLIRIAVSFTIGCFLARIFANTQTAGSHWRWLTPAMLLTIITLCYVPDLAGSFFILPLGVLVLGLAHGIDVVSRFLSHRPLVYGGEISYSLYMIHGIVLALGRKAIPADATDWNIALNALVLLAIIGAVVLAAHILYRCVEEPSRKFIRNLGRQRAAVPA